MCCRCSNELSFGNRDWWDFVSKYKQEYFQPRFMRYQNNFSIRYKESFFDISRLVKLIGPENFIVKHFWSLNFIKASKNVI